MTVAEAEGVFYPGAFPFSFGMGNQSEAGYGLFMPFQYTLLKVGVVGVSTDLNPEITLKLTHYPIDGSPPLDIVSSVVVGKSTILSLGSSLPQAGNLVAEVVSVANMTDEDAKFRMTFVFTSDEAL